MIDLNPKWLKWLDQQWDQPEEHLRRAREALERGRKAAQDFVKNGHSIIRQGRPYDGWMGKK